MFVSQAQFVVLLIELLMLDDVTARLLSVLNERRRGGRREKKKYEQAELERYTRKFVFIFLRVSSVVKSCGDDQQAHIER